MATPGDRRAPPPRPKRPAGPLEAEDGPEVQAQQPKPPPPKPFVLPPRDTNRLGTPDNRPPKPKSVSNRSRTETAPSAPPSMRRVGSDGDVRMKKKKPPPPPARPPPIKAAGVIPSANGVASPTAGGVASPTAGGAADSTGTPPPPATHTAVATTPTYGGSPGGPPGGPMGFRLPPIAGLSNYSLPARTGETSEPSSPRTSAPSSPRTTTPPARPPNKPSKPSPSAPSSPTGDDLAPPPFLPEGKPSKPAPAPTPAPAPAPAPRPVVHTGRSRAVTVGAPDTTSRSLNGHLPPTAIPLPGVAGGGSPTNGGAAHSNGNGASNGGQFLSPPDSSSSAVSVSPMNSTGRSSSSPSPTPVGSAGPGSSGSSKGRPPPPPRSAGRSNSVARRPPPGRKPGPPLPARTTGARGGPILPTREKALPPTPLANIAPPAPGSGSGSRSRPGELSGATRPGRSGSRSGSAPSSRGGSVSKAAPLPPRAGSGDGAAEYRYSGYGYDAWESVLAQRLADGASPSGLGGGRGGPQFGLPPSGYSGGGGSGSGSQSGGSGQPPGGWAGGGPGGGPSGPPGGDPAAPWMEETIETPWDQYAGQPPPEEWTTTAGGGPAVPAGMDPDSEAASAQAAIAQIIAQAEAEAAATFGTTGLAAEVDSDDEADYEDSHELLFSDTPDANGRRPIIAGTLDALIERLAYNKHQDVAFQVAFITSHTAFADSNYVLSSIIQRYCISCPPNATPAEAEAFVRDVQSPVRFQVMSVLRMWLTTRYEDFRENRELRDTLHDFIDRILPSLDLEDTSEVLRRIVREQQVKARVPPKSSLPSAIASVNWRDYSDKTLAEQLTLATFKRFSKIPISELLALRWSKPDKRESSPNILACIDFFNMVSRWVVTEIVTVTDVKARAETINRFINLAMELRMLRNFDGIMVVTAGLNALEVKRLKKSWERISQEQMRIMKHLCDVMSRDKAYKMLRDMLNTAPKPALPYLGMFLTDLTFLDDGNPKWFDTTEKMPTSESQPPGNAVNEYGEVLEVIHFWKWWKIADVITNLTSFQKEAYPMEEDRVLQYFFESGVQSLSEDETYEASVALEPPARRH